MTHLTNFTPALALIAVVGAVVALNRPKAPNHSWYRDQERKDEARYLAERRAPKP